MKKGIGIRMLALAGFAVLPRIAAADPCNDYTYCLEMAFMDPAMGDPSSCYYLESECQISTLPVYPGEDTTLTAQWISSLPIEPTYDWNTGCSTGQHLSDDEMHCVRDGYCQSDSGLMIPCE